MDDLKDIIPPTEFNSFIDYLNTFCIDKKYIEVFEGRAVDALFLVETISSNYTIVRFKDGVDLIIPDVYLNFNKSHI